MVLLFPLDMKVEEDLTISSAGLTRNSHPPPWGFRPAQAASAAADLVHV